jgi:hypothetical protein
VEGTPHRIAVSNQALEGKADAQLDLIARELNWSPPRTP